MAKHKLYFKEPGGSAKDEVNVCEIRDGWMIWKAPDIDTWTAEECLDHCNTWGIDEDAYPDEDPEIHASERRRPPEHESPEALLARVRGLCWGHLAETQDQFEMDLIAVLDTECLADMVLARLNGDEPAINDPLRRYLCEVLSDGEETDDPPRTYTVEAPCAQLAQLLAFAADGGMSPIPPEPEHVLEWPGLLALAQSYTSAEETKR